MSRSLTSSTTPDSPSVRASGRSGRTAKKTLLRDASEESADLPELARTLRRAQETLREIETSVLSGVAQSLSETTESLARTTERLESQRPQEWLTSEGAARHLGLPSTGAFERVVAKEGIPKHYISERLPRYSRRELDAWLGAR